MVTRKGQRWAEEVVKNDIDAYDAIMQGLAVGMNKVSELYEKGELMCRGLSATP